MTKTNDAVNPELAYELDAPAESAAPKKTKMTAKEKEAAAIKAEREKQKAADAKQKAKDKAKEAKDKEREKAQEAKEKEKAAKAAKKRAEALSAAAEKAGEKEADVAAKFSGGAAEKFAGLTEEQAGEALTALKEQAKEKTKAEAIAKRTELSDEETVERRNLEHVVEKNLANFQTAAFQIGGALSAINAGCLYRSTHKTFEEYVSVRFGLSKPHAYSVMAAAQTFSALTEGEVVDSKNLPSITAAEAIHRGTIRLLKEAGLDENPEVEAVTRQLARNVYALAVQSAPTDAKTGNPILSPAHITSTFSVLGEVAKSGTVQVDGKDVPLNLAAASIDEMITTESAERVARLKQSLAERIDATKATVTASSQVNKLDAALNSVTGNGREIPEGVTPRLNVLCSIHGRVELDRTTDNDVTLGCGCVFVLTPEGYTFEKNTKQPAAA